MPTPGLHFRQWSDAAGVHKYTLYIPPAEIAKPPYPMVVFLHGYGESGTDGVKQSSVGLIPAILNAPERWPCIVLAPQKPEFDPLWPTQFDVVLAEIKSVIAEVPVDETRMSLTGLSQGGNGTWMLASKHPEFWSAIAPVCGFHRQVPASQIASGVSKIPVWAFHGAKDNVVPPQQSQAIIDAIKALGATPKYTEFPNADHNSWDAAYRDKEFPKWLLAQRRAATWEPGAGR
ncbi:MAG: dienelactone hydrolase family protein [Phycisphaerales bacterium]|nr:dienelactone hydrolase family protein [Phycisphaerales bacterium]